MSISISADSISKAYSESDQLRINPIAEREYNIHHNDGMTLKIAQDGILDSVVNTIDGRRIKLEKKAEILHDYYGDRLLAKELFQQYLSYKKKTSGVANLLSFGLIGANLYSRVMSNSVLMGKVGTVTSILALQWAGRYLSNNYLEGQIQRPWKIHCHRMSKGLGPTNLPSNDHPEILTTPLRFSIVPFNTKDLFYGTLKRFAPAQTDIRVPIDAEHYPYQPDEEDMHKLISVKSERLKRGEKVEPEDDGKFIQIPLMFHKIYPWTGVMTQMKYRHDHEIYKSYMVKGGLTIWRPEHVRKKLAFEADEPDQLYKGQIIEKNLYLDEPGFADVKTDLPLYAELYTQLVNVTEDRLKLLMHQWLQRIKFNQLKKEISEEFLKTQNLDDVKGKFEEFYEQMHKENAEFLFKNLQFAAPEIEKNVFDDKKLLMLFENDKHALKTYFENIVQTRPEMVKEQKYETPYDWDFEVDVEDYDPWKEYKLIYKDLFRNGRAYYIIKSIPEWRFLQIGRPESDHLDSISDFNPKRHNNRDSIFTMLTIERYFDEREKKEGLNRGHSQAIRI